MNSRLAALLAVAALSVAANAFWYVKHSPFDRKPALQVAEHFRRKQAGRLTNNDRLWYVKQWYSSEDNMPKKGHQGLSEHDRFTYARAATYAFGFGNVPFPDRDPDAAMMLEVGKRAKPNPRGRYELQEAIRTYESLVVDFPRNGQYWLGLAYTLEAAADQASYLPNMKVRNEVIWSAATFRTESLEAYLECFRISSKKSPVQYPGNMFEELRLDEESASKIISLIEVERTGKYRSGEWEAVWNVISPREWRDNP